MLAEAPISSNVSDSYRLRMIWLINTDVFSSLGERDSAGKQNQCWEEAARASAAAQSDLGTTSDASQQDRRRYVKRTTYSAGLSSIRCPIRFSISIRLYAKACEFCFRVRCFRSNLLIIRSLQIVLFYVSTHTSYTYILKYNCIYVFVFVIQSSQRSFILWLWPRPIRNCLYALSNLYI